MHRAVICGIWLFTAFTATWTADNSKKWSYIGNTGPLYWHEIFPHACGGENQSPVDLRMEQTMYDPDLKDFAIWYDPPRPDSKMFIKNTGYTLQVDLKGDFFVTNAGLGHVFKAAQFHFHWGHKSHQGSEHLLDGEATPIEMHVVTYNHDLYNDIGEAVVKPGGLAVLGVMFELTKEDNPSFDYIIRAMKYIRNPEKAAKVELPLFSLRDLLPEDIGSYFRYNGSLTTPGCFESVIWTVFNTKQTISHNQVDQFRKLLQFKRKHHHHHKENRREARDLTSTEKEKEKHAKEVLDELGLNGKDSGFEREVFKEQLVNAKGDTEEAMAKVGSDITETEPNHTYIQDYIVNNFRPVQPLNERVVYRSFKLRDVLVVEEYDGGTAHASKVNNNEPGNGHGGDPDTASNLSVSMTTLLMSLAVFIVKMFH